jgi:hypothetical protein
MSNGIGYGLSRRGDEQRIVAVETAGSHGWRLAASHERAGDRAWPADLMRDLGRAGKRTAWILPEEDITCSQTAMPRLKSGELVRAIHGWVARQEGGAPEDWTVSWRTFSLQGARSEVQQVAMVYGHTADIDGHAAAAAGMGAEPGLMLPPSLVLDQFFRAAVPETASLNVWNIVFVGGRTNVLCVASQDGLLLTRPLPGNLSGGDRDEYVERLATEVDRSVFFARQTAGSPQVDAIFVLGDPQLASALQTKLNATGSVPCRHWLLDAAVAGVGPDVDADAQLLIMAAALATTSPQHNLAPGARGGWLSEKARRRLLVAGGALAAGVVPLLIVGGLVTGRVQDSYLEQARNDLARATVRAERAAGVYERQRLLLAREEHLNRRAASPSALEAVLHDLAAAAPGAIRFRELQLLRRDDGLVLQLTGASRAGEVADAQAAFMAFQDAVAGLPTVRPLGEPRQLQIGEVDDKGSIEQAVVFTMECKLEPPVSGEGG